MEIFSEHFKKDNILSKIDPRVKLFTAAAILIMILSYNGFLLPLIVAFISLSLCAVIKIPAKVFFLKFSEPLFLAIVIIILKAFFSGAGEMFRVNALGIGLCAYRDGLVEGLKIACRILGAVSIVGILGFSTPFSELITGFSWFRVPKGFVEILMFAYRYIFVLFDEAQLIYNAQKNRLGYSNIKRGLSSFGVLSGSLVLKAFEHNQNLTVAMVQRGYDGNIPALKHKPLKACELIASGLVITILVFIWKI